MNLMLVLHIFQIDRYKGGFLVGSGKDVVEMELNSATSMTTILSFFSNDFETYPPSSSILTCSPNIEIEDITFQNNNILNTFVAPFLPNTLEPILEPAICDPLEDIETMLSDAVLDISDAFTDNNKPIPPALSDKLLPEKMIFGEDGSKPLYVDFLSLEPIVDTLSGVINTTVSFISSFLGDEDGILQIPIDLEFFGLGSAEIRLIGLNDFTFEPLSLLGNFTLSTTYKIPYLGVEVEAELGGNETIVIKAGVNDVVFDFAFLLVIEEDILDVLPVLNELIGVISDFNMTEVTAVVSEVADFVTNLNTTEIDDFVMGLNISDITEISMHLEEIFAFAVDYFTRNFDMSVFEGIIEYISAVVEALQDIDIQGILEHMFNSIYAVEIAGLSLSSSSIDAVEVSGLTQFIGPQKLFNEVSDSLFYMYQGTLINTVDYTLQSVARDFINSIFKYSGIYDTCRGRTMYVPTDFGCLKVETFYGGKLTVDFTDPDCSNDNYVGATLSYFMYQWLNTAYFVSGGNSYYGENEEEVGNWTGQISFLEDFNSPGLEVETIMDVDLYNFNMTVTLPSCTPEFDSQMNCDDSSLRFKIDVVDKPKPISRDCSWVAAKATKQRCGLPGVSGMCAQTCGTCSACVDATNRMRVTWNGKGIARDCRWVKARATVQRCKLDGVANACRATCGKC